MTIDRLSLNLNPTRFIPIDDESETALEAMGKLEGKVNESVDKVNDNNGRINTLTTDVNKKEYSTDITSKRKLSTNGDFTGTWYGVPFTQASSGMSSDYNQAMLPFNTLTSKLIDMEDNSKKSNDKLLNLSIDLVKDFGGSTLSNDNHDNIMNALNYLNSHGGGKLIIPKGIFKTSPIKMEVDPVGNSYKNITIEGVTPSLPWLTGSVLKFISSGSVGIQLSEEAGLGYTNYVPTWFSKNIWIKHIRLDCNSIVDSGLNGCRDIHMEDVTIEHAIKDGIVFEPQTYPIILRRVYSRFNGRDGVHVKAPFTTVWNMYDCEFQSNDGYGLYIEDGNTCLLENVIIQSNKRGGLKINKINVSPSPYSDFLGKITFISLYTEGNGLLLPTDPNYDGNNAVKIVSYDTTPQSNVGKIDDLTFINCSINYGGGASGWSIQGVGRINTIGTDIPDNAINYNQSGTLGMRTNIITIRDDLSQTYPVAKSYPYNDSSRNIKTFVGHGYVGLRGRMRELQYTLSKDLIVAGQSILMNTNGLYKFYPVLQKGSLYGINAIKGIAPTSGSLTFKIKYGFKSGISGGVVGEIVVPETMVIDSSHPYFSINFPLLRTEIDGAYTLAIEVTASSDYVAGHSSYSDILCELFIES